jgi:cytochrome c oxidase accessory protein FixG
MTSATREQVVSLYAKQPKIQPRAVSGWFHRWRWALVWATQLVFYGSAWLTWNGRQALLFDLTARRFFIGPLVLYPQDFIYLTGLLIFSALALFLFTAVAGRLWCGYACPQTVYTELFLWIEQRLEGNRNARLRLDAAPVSVNKLLRRGGKHLAWVALSLWTGFTFVGYFTPIRELAAAVPAGALSGWEVFWIAFYSLATYGNAGWMREQVCKYMCPYARFQSAMFDRNTLVIGYDERRGEPRGRRAADTAAAAGQGKPLGDCIDCGLCVQVCPTGIDIRHGLQYECIGCAACIDVCNGVMKKMQYAPGLIRYETQAGLAGTVPSATAWQRLRSSLARPRVAVYSGLWVLLGVALLALLALRPALRMDVVRDRGVLSRQVAGGAVENVYRLQLMNATEAPLAVQLSVSGLAGAQVVRAPEVVLAPAEARWVPVAVQLPPSTVSGLANQERSQTLMFEAHFGAGQRVVERSTFLLPR